MSETSTAATAAGTACRRMELTILARLTGGCLLGLVRGMVEMFMWRCPNGGWRCVIMVAGVEPAYLEGGGLRCNTG